MSKSTGNKSVVAAESPVGWAPHAGNAVGWVVNCFRFRGAFFGPTPFGTPAVTHHDDRDTAHGAHHSNVNHTLFQRRNNPYHPPSIPSLQLPSALSLSLGQNCSYPSQPLPNHLVTRSVPSLCPEQAPQLVRAYRTHPTPRVTPHQHHGWRL
jgi:hypothetical protein